MLADLTPAMQAALIRAHTQGLPCTDPGVHPRTVQALQTRGLIHRRTSQKGRTSWRATDTGRGLVCMHVPRLLAARSQYGYTHRPSQAMWQEPEAA